jgi:pyruvate-formate lyase-activating enzyme
VPVPSRDEVDRLVAEVGVVKAGGQLGVAALLYTYRCTIACRHCCFGCGGERPDVHMSTDKAVKYLADLHETGRVIHIAGGECMMYWDELQEVLARSAAEGCRPHFIETNCSFAVGDDVVRRRLDVLRRCGVVGILLSADPYHQAFVPPESFIRTRRIARDVFGPRNVWCTGASDEEVVDFAAVARNEERLREFVRAHPPVLVGAAHHCLRRFFDEYPLTELPLGGVWRDPPTGPDCAIVFDPQRIWELHIDPYDNIQTNCGIILGKATEITPLEIIRRGPGTMNEISRIVTAEGPLGLVRMARQRHGFVPPAKARSRCDLCYTVRRFLRPFYPDILGPAEVYGTEPKNPDTPY